MSKTMLVVNEAVRTCCGQPARRCLCNDDDILLIPTIDKDHTAMMVANMEARAKERNGVAEDLLPLPRMTWEKTTKKIRKA